MLKELSLWFFPAVRPLRGATARCRTHPGAGCSQPGTAAGSGPGSSLSHLLYIAAPHPAVCSSTLATRGHAGQPGPGIIKNRTCFFSPPQSCCKHTLPRGCVHRGTGCHLRSLLGTLHCPHCPPTTGAAVARGCTGTACHPLPHCAVATSCCSCLGLLMQHAWELGGSPQKASTGAARIWVCLGQHSDRHDRWHRCCDPEDEMRRMPGMPAPWLGKTGRPQPSESSETHPVEQHLCPVLAPVFFSCPTWR